MDDFVPAFCVTVLGALLALRQASRFARWEYSMLLASFAAHVISACAQVWLTRGLYGDGDLFGYAWRGEAIAAVLRNDLAQFGPEILKILFHQDVVFPVAVAGAGSSTGAMDAIAGILSFLTGGSTYTLCLVVAIAAYFGKVALYRAFSTSFPGELHRRLLLAAALLPSVVFWSSGLLKEAVAMVGVGYYVLGLVQLRTRTAGSLLRMVLGAVVVGIVKAYILFPLVFATGVYFWSESVPAARRTVRPVHLIVGALVAIGGIIALGQIFPRYAIDSLAEQAAINQEIGQRVRGASTYAMGDPTQRKLSGQLMFAPIALVTALFRPFIFEATKPQLAVSALETTALLILSIRALARSGLGRARAIVLGSPLLTFSLVFTLTFAVAVGLSTTNLGALSRYRIPLVPFFCALVLVLDARRHSLPAALESGQPGPRAGRGALPVP